MTAPAAAIPRRRLGRSGLQVTAFGLGGVGVGSVYGAVSDEEAIRTVRAAVESGVNYIDTSPLYGESERRIGLALEGGLRDRVVLSTKTGTHPARHGDYSWDGTLWSVENSLKLLKTDHIDLLMVHDPDDLAPVFAPGGALEALESLKEQGIIRAIGLGQRNHEFHRTAIESGRFDAILTYADYNLLNQSAAAWLLPLAKAHDVGVINAQVLSQGLLSGEDPTVLAARPGMHATGPEQERARDLYHWCQQEGVSLLAMALQFSLRSSMVQTTIVGAKTPAELQQNLHAAAHPVPDELWARFTSRFGL